MFAYNLSLVIFILSGPGTPWDPEALSRMGRKGATEIFKHEGTNLWVPTLTRPFPNGQMNAGSWLAQKKMLLQAISNSDYRAHTAPLFSKLEILDIFQVSTLDTAKFLFH